VSVTSQLATLAVNVSGTDSPTAGYFWGNASLDSQTLHWTHFGETGEIGYFAVVPTITSEHLDPEAWWNSSYTDEVLTYYTFGEVWIALPAYPNNETEVQYINCELYNASATYDVVFTNHVGVIQNISKEFLDRINPYEIWSVTSPEDYSPLDSLGGSAALFKEVAALLIGTVSSADNPILPLQQDALLGTFQSGTNMLTTILALVSQVNEMSKEVFASTGRDAAYFDLDTVRNVSFSDAVEELALNASLSILSQRSFWYASRFFSC
jgi:hypothetical protein